MMPGGAPDVRGSEREERGDGAVVGLEGGEIDVRDGRADHGAFAASNRPHVAAPREVLEARVLA